MEKIGNTCRNNKKEKLSGCLLIFSVFEYKPIVDLRLVSKMDLSHSGILIEMSD